MPTRVEVESTDILSLNNQLLEEVRIDDVRHPAIGINFDTIASIGKEGLSLIKEIMDKKDLFPMEDNIVKAKDGKGLYRLVNASKGDVLKECKKDGTLYGAIMTKDGKSKMGKFIEVSGVETTSKAASIMNPYVLLIVLAISIINHKMDVITNLEKEILSFLESDKESEIEGDLETLTNIIKKFKDNYDNEKFISSNYKLVLDIQRTMRKNMIFYSKELSSLIEERTIFNNSYTVSELVSEQTKKFKYYRLAIYSYSLASFLEIVLSGNYKDEYVSTIKEDIAVLDRSYKDLHSKGIERIKYSSNLSIESAAVKGAGAITKGLGKLFSKIKETDNTKKMITSGEEMSKKAIDMNDKYIDEFKSIEDPGLSIYMDKMEELIFLFNKTSLVCMDEDKIYLVEA